MRTTSPLYYRGGSQSLRTIPRKMQGTWGACSIQMVLQSLWIFLLLHIELYVDSLEKRLVNTNITISGFII